MIDPVNMPTICDSVWVDIHEEASPNNTIYTAHGLLNINGDLSIQFPNMVCGSYYIAVRTRLAVETWYKYPFIIGNPNTSIDLSQYLKLFLDASQN